ncbi:MAG: DNA polymerase III subunit epsilon [bacterium]
MRQIVLDTETTGLETAQDHRIIEIGCVELLNRKLTGNHYHQYIKPDREIDEGALAVHGISNEFLADKPRFEQIVEQFLDFVDGAELVIHNAPFDVGFINHELSKLNGRYPPIDRTSSIVDSLVMARKKHPGQKNNLDALCKRYDVDNSQRDLHGALLDAEILADVYLALTGGQVDLSLGQDARGGAEGTKADTVVRLSGDRKPLRVIKATDDELALHQNVLDGIEKSIGEVPLWRQKYLT